METSAYDKLIAEASDAREWAKEMENAILVQIEQTRLQLGLTVDKYAEIFDLSPGYYLHLVRGKSDNRPAMRYLLIYCYIFNTDIATMLGKDPLFKQFATKEIGLSALTAAHCLCALSEHDLTNLAFEISHSSPEENSADVRRRATLSINDLREKLYPKD